MELKKLKANLENIFNVDNILGKDEIRFANEMLHLTETTFTIRI